MKKSYILTILFCLISFLIYLGNINMHNHPKKIVVYLGSEPYSSDPIEYDSFIHHVVFESTYTNLVTQYKLGQHTPMLAESWKISEDRKEWTFFLRKDFKFSDGSIINAESIEKSWLRIAKIMKARNSKSGFLENIVGYEQLTKESHHLDGLTANDFTLKIQLTQPMPKLLDKVSFGLYSVVHQSQFDSQTLKWNEDKKNIITSGAYQITEWNKDRIKISLTKNYYKELLHNNPIEEIEFYWSKEKFNEDTVDVIYGSEITPPFNKKFILQAGPQSYIYFVRLLSFKNKNSLFYDKENRIIFRNNFYKNLELSGIKTIKSFFPLIIKNIKEVDNSNINESNSLTNFDEKNITIPTYPKQIYHNLVADNSIEAIKSTANNFNLKAKYSPISLQILFDEIEKNKTNTTWDIARYSTGILASDPIEDVKFMFRSKEGILLPDETGEILTELDKSPVDLQKVNQLLWDQGLIWPVTHYASGLWARPDLDFSQINLVLPPTSFQWIGWKN